MTVKVGNDIICKGKGWTVAAELKPNDILTTADGKRVEVESVTVIKLTTPIMVYNLEIEENHTYYVSADEVLVHNMCKPRKKAGKKSKAKGDAADTSLSLQQALDELDKSGLRPGQTELHRSQLDNVLDSIQNDYDPMKAYSSVYSDGKNRYLVEGHHTTVAFKMLGKDAAINMNTATSDLPSVTNVYWAKKWYQFWRKTIKIVED